MGEPAKKSRPGSDHEKDGPDLVTGYDAGVSKALLLSYWNLNQAASGGIRRINALLRALHGKVLVCQPGPPHPEVDTLCYRIDFGRKKRGINWGMFNFLWPANARLVRKTIILHQPSVIILTSMWNYFPLRRLGGNSPVVLDAHDVNAIAVGERLGSGHPFTRLVRGWERYVTRRLDHLFTCSEQDREHFIAMYSLDPEKVTVAPNGVDPFMHHGDAGRHPLPGGIEERLQGSTVLFFMGKLDYQPNREALAFLVREVLPELEQQQPGAFKLLLCGGPPPTRLDHPSVVYAGVLPREQLAAALQRADICLAPIMSGSGTRLKVLEYMASGKPVIATPKGAEGIPAKHEHDLCFADPSGFANAILNLARDPAQCRGMGDAARRFVTDHFDWTKSAAPRWHAVLDRWLA